MRRFVMRPAAFRTAESGCRSKKGRRGILDPLFQIVRHCSLKFGCLVWGHGVGNGAGRENRLVFLSRLGAASEALLCMSVQDGASASPPPCQGKMAKSALRPTFGLPKVPVAVCTSLGLAGRPEKREYSRQIGSHPGKMLGWRISGRLERAKTLLASMVNGDLAAVNAIIAAPQLIVDGLHKMRQLAADPALRSSIMTDAAVDECLFAPPPLYARRKPPARSAVVPLEEARSSSLGWEARAKAQRIVTSSSSVRVGAAVPPKSGCLRYWKACGRVSQLRCMSLKKTSRPSLTNS